MRKSEIFTEILSVVSSETEIAPEEILSASKVVEVVDARSILVRLLREFGFYPSQIAAFLNRSSASIRYLLSNYDDREIACKIIENYMNNIRSILKSKQIPNR